MIDVFALQQMFRKNRRIVDRGEKPVEKRGERLAQMEDGRVAIGRIDAGDQIPSLAREHVRLWIEDRPYRERDVSRRERGAVVPEYAAPQFECKRFTIGRNKMVRFGRHFQAQRGNRIAALVEDEEIAHRKGREVIHERFG